MSMVISDSCAESGQVQGNVRVISGGQLTLYGHITGTLIVRSGGEAHIRGMVGHLVVEPGAIVQLHGMCTGDVTNHGGDLVIAGTVSGVLFGAANTRITQGASIGRIAA
ncbi:hypothetical protein [Mycolicibacterium mucogenicum]|uniref:hypothetical protein n=1 Tax=Mycolicibacterium mucogenicum TaxID=56689 RepID=UPI001A96534E|nr:hypothetical protein [Mycolicibacterium mucogenicum]